MRTVRQCLSLILTILCYGLSNTAWCQAAFAEDSATSAHRIIATYRVDFGGFNLGSFRLTTVLRGSEYEARGDGQLSVLGGLLYAWRGSTASKGKLTDGVPEPATYAFDYNGGDGNQRLRVAFDNGAVSQVSWAPPYKPDPHVVPVTKEQLQGVLDPATALFLYARSNNPAGDLSVCHHTVPVFDGEQRFDLVLKPKRTVSIQKNASSVYSGFATVCRVKFNPISGYRTDDPDIRFISRSNEIEVWLVSLPKVGMYVPYRIVLPTVSGYASATSTFLKIETDAKTTALRF
jgi:hypothetical protein